jgi:hypothetical protein
MKLGITDVNRIGEEMKYVKSKTHGMLMQTQGQQGKATGTKTTTEH